MHVDKLYFHWMNEETPLKHNLLYWYLGRLISPVKDKIGRENNAQFEQMCFIREVLQGTSERRWSGTFKSTHTSNPAVSQPSVSIVRGMINDQSIEFLSKHTSQSALPFKWKDHHQGSNVFNVQWIQLKCTLYYWMLCGQNNRPTDWVIIRTTCRHRASL